MRIFLFVLSLYCFDIYSQQYKLLPDSCTYCFLYYTPPGQQSTNVQSEYRAYSILPQDDTLINGFIYIKVKSIFEEPFVRQEGNKLWGLGLSSMNPSTNNIERLIMDFDAEVGDTIFNLFSSEILYDAVVNFKDSILLANGTYHHFILLKVIYFDSSSGNWVTTNIDIRWDEKGLCNYNGGILYSIPFSDFWSISNITYCTSDTLYSNNPYYGTCDSCNLKINYELSLLEKIKQDLKIYPNPSTTVLNIYFENASEKTIRILDLLGNELLQIKAVDKNSSISVEQLKEGLYFVEISLKNEFESETLVSSFVKE